MKIFTVVTLICAASLQAQIPQTRIPVADQKVTEQQADQIFRALRAVNFEAKEVVFPLYAGRQRIAFGISIGEGKLLTKASEVTQRRMVFTENREQESLAAQVIGLYPDHDLAVLYVPGLKAPAAKWADAAKLAEGAFLTAIRPDGEAVSMGVLSVRERSLKSTDQGFLGIDMDTLELESGVRVIRVFPASAAAEVGIRGGDVITKIAGEEVSGFYQLSTKLRRLRSGDQPEIEFLRGGVTRKVKPKLKGREIQEGRSQRLNRMDQMSGTQSRIREDFGNVIQSDMELEASDAGLPVVDLEGRIVGMVIARAGRISTLILPGDDVADTLAGEPEPFVVDRRVTRRRAQPDEARRERVRRMTEELQRALRRQ